MYISAEEVELLRQWFDTLSAVAPTSLVAEDYQLGTKISKVSRAVNAVSDGFKPRSNEYGQADILPG